MKIYTVKNTDFDIYDDWIINEDAILAIHECEATHICDEDGCINVIERGFFDSGEPYVMVGEQIE
jgi:hypothetical protein